jgi:hypothetical protein
MSQPNATADSYSQSPHSAGWLNHLPPGWSLSRVAFVTQPTNQQQVLFSLPIPLQGAAILLSADGKSTSDGLPTIDVLSIPTSIEATSDEATLAAAEGWLNATAVSGDEPSLRMTLQAAQIMWRPGRLAMIAPADRLIAMRDALLTAAYLEAELAGIERALGAAWPQLEADVPHAFEFAAAALSQRRRLRQRFQDALLLRAKLARLGPHVHAPHLHPPTLASQVAERFRDRTRLAHRHEFLDEQLQVFERVYENCGQRASDFTLTRSGNALEWIVILLLLTQTLLLVFDLLSNNTQ